MAAQLKQELNVDAELIESGGGVFEVEHDDALVFSKKELDRFPEDDEVLGLLRGRMQP